MRTVIVAVFAACLSLPMVITAPAAAAPAAEDTARVIQDNWALLFGTPDERQQAAARLRAPYTPIFWSLK